MFSQIRVRSGPWYRVVGGGSANKIPGMPRHRPHRADLDTAVRLATANSQSGRTSCVIAMVSPISSSSAEWLRKIRLRLGDNRIDR
jgi:hypothetical protein